MTGTYTVADQEHPMRIRAPHGRSGAPIVALLESGVFGDADNEMGHADHLASWGFVVVVPDDLDIESSSQTSRNAGRVSAALDAVYASLGTQVTDRVGVAGTHFNGVSALYLAAHDPRIDAVVGLHPATLSASDASLAGLVAAPTLILAGSQSGGGLLCPIGATFDLIYGRSASPQRAAFLFDGASPADFQDPPYEVPLGFCPAPSDHPFPWIAGLMTSWFKFYLEGDSSFRGFVFTDTGDPKDAPQIRDSVADTAPVGLVAVPEGENGARLSWDVRITDTTALNDVIVLRAQGQGTMSAIGSVPLGVGTFGDTGLTAGVTYSYTVAYRDRAERRFQLAEPVELAGGAPTPTVTSTATPTRTPRPTITSRPTNTATPTSPDETATPTGGPTAIPTWMAYLPAADNASAPRTAENDLWDRTIGQSAPIRRIRSLSPSVKRF
jgi:hypothetical protein